MSISDESYSIVSNREIADGIFHAALEAAESRGAAKIILPGQFALIKVADATTPMLRRPISYLKANGGFIEFAYRVVGTGTEILSKTVEGARLKILGPLGNGFDVSQLKSNVMLVAGGIGIAPIFFLADYLFSKKIGGVTVVYGARSEKELALSNEAARISSKMIIVTDDGSAGVKGLASDAAVAQMKENPPEAVFVCGPHPMMRAIAVAASSLGIPCKVSVEARMACGVGACLGCVVETANGNKCVCRDGPVFDSKEIFSD